MYQTKYFKNLTIENDRIFSYGTHVASIIDGYVVEHAYYSKTTRKHINYVASLYKLPLRYKVYVDPKYIVKK